MSFVLKHSDFLYDRVLVYVLTPNETQIVAPTEGKTPHIYWSQMPWNENEVDCLYRRPKHPSNLNIEQT